MLRKKFDEDGYISTDWRFDETTARSYISHNALVVGDYGGSGVYGEANIRYCDEHVEGCLIDHGSYGHRQAWLPDNPDNVCLVEDLDKYPVICDDHLHAVEEEWEDEAWDSDGVHEIVRAIHNKAKTDPNCWLHPEISNGVDEAQITEDMIDCLGKCELKEIYHQSLKVADAAPSSAILRTPFVKFDYTSACLPYDEIAGSYAGVVQAAFWKRVLDCTGDTVLFNFHVVDERRIAADWLDDHGMISFAEVLRNIPDEYLFPSFPTLLFGPNVGIYYRRLDGAPPIHEPKETA